MCCACVTELHAKDKGLHKACAEIYGTTIKREHALEFVKCCPVCIQAKPRKKQVAGHKPIITHGFGSRGQV